MKKILFGLLLASTGILFFACQQDGLLLQDDALIQQIATSAAKTTINPDALPAEIANYVSTNYAPLSVESASLVQKLGYEVMLENNFFLYFNRNQECLGAGDGPGGFGGPHPPHHGGCMKGDTIDLATLPTAITDHVVAFYPDATITVAVVKPSGKYGVELSDGATLIFDADGVFLTLCGECPSGPPPPHPGCMEGDTVAATDLPQAAQDFLLATYPDLTIQTVVVKPIGVFAVELSDGAILLFSPEGVFIHLCGEYPGPHPNPHPGCMTGDTVTIADLPQAAQDYVAITFPDLTIQTVVVKLNGFFAVELSDGQILLFDAAGTFLHDCDNDGPGGNGGPGGDDDNDGHGGHGGPGGNGGPGGHH
ncbi:MAG: PepSY-like domain-containing protein [Saprospirales bacterium]|nr:PepSY-like domain-containing protein [Saprospirales bacterium]